MGSSGSGTARCARTARSRLPPRGRRATPARRSGSRAAARELGARRDRGVREVVAEVDRRRDVAVAGPAHGGGGRSCSAAAARGHAAVDARRDQLADADADLGGDAQRADAQRRRGGREHGHVGARRLGLPRHDGLLGEPAAHAEARDAEAQARRGARALPRRAVGRERLSSKSAAIDSRSSSDGPRDSATVAVTTGVCGVCDGASATRTGRATGAARRCATGSRESRSHESIHCAATTASPTTRPSLWWPASLTATASPAGSSSTAASSGAGHPAEITSTATPRRFSSASTRATASRSPLTCARRGSARPARPSREDRESAAGARDEHGALAGGSSAPRSRAADVTRRVARHHPMPAARRTAARHRRRPARRVGRAAAAARGVVHARILARRRVARVGARRWRRRAGCRRARAAVARRRRRWRRRAVLAQRSFGPLHGGGGGGGQLLRAEPPLHGGGEAAGSRGGQLLPPGSFRPQPGGGGGGGQLLPSGPLQVAGI